MALADSRLVVLLVLAFGWCLCVRGSSNTTTSSSSRLSDISPLSPISLPPSAGLSFLPSSSVPIPDLGGGTCTIRSVEIANERQLGTVIQAIRSKQFFRWFKVDMGGDCEFFNQGKDIDKCPSEKPELQETVTKWNAEGETEKTEKIGFMPGDGDAIGQPGCKLESSPPPSVPFSPVSSPIIHSPLEPSKTMNCTDPDSEHFWHDMCNHLEKPADDSSNHTLIDLTLNEERNTYYNGSSIWSSIYYENCKRNVEADTPYEETVMYRLLSGFHSSTTISVAKRFYPPSKKRGTLSEGVYSPNPSLIFTSFSDHPEYVTNLHFLYVVLLRALSKSGDFLMSIDYTATTGNATEGIETKMLIKRLLDSAILSECETLFTAYDETELFQDKVTAPAIKANFKSMFHNVTKIITCVQCQQCKLHAKMTLLGIGAALKMLLVDEITDDVITRNEIVAFVNTLGRVSESITDLGVLSNMYWEEKSFLQHKTHASSTPTDILDVCVSTLRSLGKSGSISPSREFQLVEEALSDNDKLLVICRYYHDDVKMLTKLVDSLIPLEGEVNSPVGGVADPKSASSIPKQQFKSLSSPTAIVVGTGLAGLSATLRILDRGGTVVLIDKELRMGGNSAKASSGINSCAAYGGGGPDELDSQELFVEDTTRSAGSAANKELIDVLVRGSEEAVKWLRERINVDLSSVAQLGGHSASRTRRPSNGMVGAEIIYGMSAAIRKYESRGMVNILLGRRVVDLIEGGGSKETGATEIIGVKVLRISDNSTTSILSSNTILATGGFASDRSPSSYLSKYRPELTSMPATAGDFSTGDGISLATSKGATVINMDKVQLHPTGWVDPKDEHAKTKTLAAELMRGVGGVLINDRGKRFCNEVSTR